MIADPMTLEVLQGVPVAPKVDEPEDPSQLNADLQAGSNALEEESPLDDNWSEVKEVPAAAAVADRPGGADMSSCDGLAVLSDSFAQTASSGLKPR